MGEEYVAQHRAWREAAAAVQAAITDHAAATDGVSRYKLEMGVKNAARSREDPAE